MRRLVYILLLLSFTSCNKSLNSSGDIKFINDKKENTEVVFHNDNTSQLRNVGIFLSTDELLTASSIKVRVKVTAPNKIYWIDTLCLYTKNVDIKNFSGRKELFCKAYKNVCFLQGGDYLFEVKTIGVDKKLTYMIGVIVDNK